MIQQKFLFFSIVLLLLLYLTGCTVSTAQHEALAHLEVSPIVDLDNPKFNGVELELEQGDTIYLWSEMDVEFSGKVDFIYLVRVTDPRGKITRYEMHHMEGGLRSETLNQQSISLNGRTSWSFSNQHYTYHGEHDGAYLFEAALFVDPRSNGAIFSTNQSDLILKR